MGDGSSYDFVTKLCLTLCNPMDYNPPGSSVRGILQSRILEWVAISFSKGSLTQGWNPRLLHWQADSLSRLIVYHYPNFLCGFWTSCQPYN